MAMIQESGSKYVYNTYMCQILKQSDTFNTFVIYILISVLICSVEVGSKEDCPQCSVAKEWGRDGCFYHIRT